MSIRNSCCYFIISKKCFNRSYLFLVHICHWINHLYTVQSIYFTLSEINETTFTEYIIQCVYLINIEFYHFTLQFVKNKCTVWSVLIAVEVVKITKLATMSTALVFEDVKQEHRVTDARTVHVIGLPKSTYELGTILQAYIINFILHRKQLFF